MTKNYKIIIITICFLVIATVALGGYLIVKQMLKSRSEILQPNIALNRLFYSEFTNKKDIKGFEIIDSNGAQDAPSKWEITNGFLVQKSSIYKNDHLNPGSLLIIKNGSDWQNYEANIKFIPEKNGVFGFVVRYQNNKNFYKITITCNQGKNGPNIKIEKIQNGSVSTLYGIKKCFNLNHQNQIKIEVIGNRINLYLNSDSITIYGIDKTTIIDKGTFGFLISQMPGIKIDNIEIKKIYTSDLESNSTQVLSNQTEEQRLDSEIQKIINEIGF